MTDLSSFSISVVALLATFYQAHLQRVHNQKSVKPLPQIDLVDREKQKYIHIQNNGVGPFIVEKLVFIADRKKFSRIEDCLDFDPKSYEHIEINKSNSKVLPPGGFLVVFAKDFNEGEKLEGDKFREQLSKLSMQVAGRDIYNNKIVLEQNFQWFARHIKTI